MWKLCKEGKKKKMNKKILICFAIMFILGISFFLIKSVIAVDSFKQNENITLTQACDNCTSINITYIKYPNGNINNTILQMNRIGNVFTYNFSETSQIGDYVYYTTSDLNGLKNTLKNEFIITPTGFVLSTSDSIIVLIIFITMLSLSIALFYMGFKIEDLNIKIFLLFLSGLIFAFMVGYVLSTGNSFLSQFSNQTISINTIFILFISIISVGIIGLILYLIYYSLNLFYKTRGFKD